MQFFTQLLSYPRSQKMPTNRGTHRAGSQSLEVSLAKQRGTGKNERPRHNETTTAHRVCQLEKLFDSQSQKWKGYKP